MFILCIVLLKKWYIILHCWLCFFYKFIRMINVVIVHKEVRDVLIRSLGSGNAFISIAVSFATSSLLRSSVGPSFFLFVFVPLQRWRWLRMWPSIAAFYLCLHLGQYWLIYKFISLLLTLYEVGRRKKNLRVAQSII